MNSSVPHSPTSEVRWAMDAFVISGKLLFAYGWSACSRRSPDTVLLELVYADGKAVRVVASSGLDRRDVSDHHPDLPGNCGFLIYTAIGQQPIKLATLILRDNAERELARLPLSGLFAAAAEQGRAVSGGTAGLGMLRRLAGKVWLHLRQGNFAFLREHVVRLLPKLLSSKESQGNLAQLVESLPPRMALIVDHDLGGGANIFRDRLIDKLSAEGQAVALLTFVPAILSHHLKIVRPEAPPIELRVAADWWLTLAASRKFSTVYFNNCVSHPEPERMPEVLLHFKRVAAARLIMFMHDFHVVCPSHFLLDQDGRYCGIPDPARCRNCLPRIEDNLAALFVARDIDVWRASWQSCLVVADEVVCFAPSGRELLLRAYPELATREIIIRPHDVRPLGNKYRYPGASAPLTIAVVGMINLHKGSQVVLDLAEEIERRGLPARICIVGTLNAVGRSKIITQTGRYRPEEIPDLLVSNGVHLALMPSIWPETFSFVTHELISTGVPLMSFDLGAQGDAVRAYRLGQVVAMHPASQLLDDILAFKTHLDRSLGDAVVRSKTVHSVAA